MNLPIFLWLILLPVLAAPVIYLAGRLTRARLVRLSGWLALLALLVTWIPFVLAASRSTRNFRCATQCVLRNLHIPLGLEGMACQILPTNHIWTALAVTTVGRVL